MSFIYVCVSFKYLSYFKLYYIYTYISLYIFTYCTYTYKIYRLSSLSSYTIAICRYTSLHNLATSSTLFPGTTYAWRSCPRLRKCTWSPGALSLGVWEIQMTPVTTWWYIDLWSRNMWLFRPKLPHWGYLWGSLLTLDAWISWTVFVLSQWDWTIPNCWFAWALQVLGWQLYTHVIKSF